MPILTCQIHYYKEEKKSLRGNIYDPIHSDLFLAQKIREIKYKSNTRIFPYNIFHEN